MEKEQLLNKLGNRIREIRKEKGITQVELANSIGKDQQSVQRLESGNINPSFYYVYEVAKGLDIPLKGVLALGRGFSFSLRKYRTLQM